MSRSPSAHTKPPTRASGRPPATSSNRWQIDAPAFVHRWPRRRAWPARAGIDAPPPSDAVLVDAAIDDAVLLREALDRAYDRRDPVVRARLLTLGRYLGLAA